MKTWKQLFGEPVVVIGAVVAGLQAVNWTALHNQTVQIAVSAVLGIGAVLLARAQVTPVATAKAQLAKAHRRKAVAAPAAPTEAPKS